MLVLDAQIVISAVSKPTNSLKWDLETWQSMIIILRKHQLLARFCFLIKEAGFFEQLPEYAQKHLRNAELLAKKQYVQVLYEAKELLTVITPVTKSVLFLKGAAYSLSGYKVGIGRTYSDIDVLVPKHCISAVETRLNLFGWMAKTISKYDEMYYRKWAHEIPSLAHSGRGTVLDLHHNIVPIVSNKAPDITAIMDHISVTKDNIKIPKPYTMFLHSAVHLFFNEDFKSGFRDLLDLHLIIEEFGDDEFWENLVQLAKETEFEKEVYLACRYLSLIIHAEVPSNLAQRINFKPSVASNLYWDFMFKRLLSPNHRLIKMNWVGLAGSLALIRGHYLKMPLSVLIAHTVFKGYIGIIKFIFGPNAFERDESR